jgi:hypothetical protein
MQTIRWQSRKKNKMTTHSCQLEGINSLFADWKIIHPKIFILRKRRGRFFRDEDGVPLDPIRTV